MLLCGPKGRRPICCQGGLWMMICQPGLAVVVQRMYGFHGAKAERGRVTGLFSPVAESPGLVFCRYEQMKREYKDTAQLCLEAGFTFSPMVLEAHAGGWSPLTRHTFDWLAKAQAASQHEDPSIVSLRIAQRISCTLQAENARAILQRTVGPSSAERPPSGWDEI